MEFDFKFDINELLQEARISGYYDISKIEYAVMETNGKISFLSKSKYDVLTPNDMKIKVDKSSLVTNLVIDSKVMKKHLKKIGKDEKWLVNRLNSLGYKSLDDILLVTCDNKEKLTVFEKNYDIDETKFLE